MMKFGHSFHVKQPLLNQDIPKRIAPCFGKGCQQFDDVSTHK